MMARAAGSVQSLRLNLGGEGEVLDVINQQPEWRDLNAQASRTGTALRILLTGGHAFLFCDHCQLPFPDKIVDEVLTNGVPIDQSTFLGPGIPSVEIKRVLRSGGWKGACEK